MSPKYGITPQSEMLISVYLPSNRYMRAFRASHIGVGSHIPAASSVT